MAAALETRNIPSLDLMTDQQAQALIDWMTEELKQVPALRQPGEDG